MSILHGVKVLDIASAFSEERNDLHFPVLDLAKLKPNNAIALNLLLMSSWSDLDLIFASDMISKRLELSAHQ